MTSSTENYNYCQVIHLSEIRVRMEDGSRKEIEIRNDGTSIQWRYTDQNEWKELILLADLKGEDGKPPEFEIREGHLIVKYE